MSSSLKNTWSEIKDDLPANGFFMSKFLYHFFLNPKFRLLLNHRIGKYFYFHSFTFLKPIAIYYKNRLIIKRSCDISYHTKIEKKLLLQYLHCIGIVDKGVINDHVTIFKINFKSTV
uniref:hypothetical protein n=1 Tax=Flavobacterium sp. TaxID=239 RepID=UPI0040493A85